jgi:N-formylglutamate amidohydrolase
MKRSFWLIETDHSPIVATALHCGHEISAYLKKNLEIDESDRLREEDPFTDIFTQIVENRVIDLHSRFEIDLNRPRDKAVYRSPEDAWGLHVWHTPLTKSQIDKSLFFYDAFYKDMKAYFSKIIEKYGYVVVLDLHSYNHHRAGSEADYDDPLFNPEINVGTKTLQNPEKWHHLIERVVDEMHQYNYMGRHLDVRENVKFYGGYFAQWIHHNFYPNACVLSIEFQKFFMDEWSGKPDFTQIEEIKKLLSNIIPVIYDELSKIKDHDG